MDIPVLLVAKSFLAALVILLLPGGALLAWGPDRERDLLEWLAEAVGLSISLTALIALYCWAFGWPVTALELQVYYGGLALGGVAGRIVRRRTPSFGSGRPLFLIVLAALIVWRFYQVRGLAFPPWVDAPHHVLIIRKILETGGLPSDLNPYLSIPFFYHFGFHVLTALFAAFSGAPLEKAALWMGQLMNALVSLSIYYLGRSVWPQPGRAGLAALFSGFVSQMPAYYATWGRYSLLCGLVLLPLALGTAWDTRRTGRSLFTDARQALLTAGTALAHYFAAALLGMFALVLGGAGVWTAARQKVNWREVVLKPLVGFCAGAALLWPWLLWLGERVRAYLWIQWKSPTRPLTETYFNDYGTYLVYLLGPARNYLLIFLALLGLVWSWRNPRIRILSWWGLFLGLGVIPWGGHLAPFRPDHLAIVLFLPVCLLAGHFTGEALSRIKRKYSSSVPQAVALTLLLALLIWGLKETRFIIRPETILAGADDRQAIRWIGENTPAGARFLIRPAPWEWGLYRGRDGGYWITALTGRWSSLPPVLYGFGSPGQVKEINNRAQRTREADGCGPAFWDLVRSLKITHIYTRDEDGPLASRDLAGCQGLETAYRGGRVVLFKVP